EKSFDGEPVLRGVSLALRAGEIVVLLGPSGCGKTTLLRILAGLEVADNGRLLLNEQDLSRIPVHQRGFGMVFQDYALFPHKNVFENVAFGLRMQNWDKRQLQERVMQVLALVGLVGFGERPIYELSGGEQQRVALARSLAPAPRLILLDEPLGALDRALRERLMLDLRHILKEAGGVMGRPEGITTIYVTHDQAEAFAIADRVMVMNRGQIDQVGAPLSLYRHPQTPFVARFLGMQNLFEVRLLSTVPLVAETEIGRLEIGTGMRREPEEWDVANGGQVVGNGNAQKNDVDHLGKLSLRRPINPLLTTPYTLLIRPEAARLPADDDPATLNVVNGRLTDTSFRGRYQIASFAVGDAVLKFEFDTAVALPSTGEPVRLQLKSDSMVLLERG
ncbi:MAG: ABC transporter ATP-binding protein, partial [Anaerolineae bacterium]